MVELSHSVEIGVRSLATEDRQLLQAWFARLEGWANDISLRELVRPVGKFEGGYHLETGGTYDMFFRVEVDGEEPKVRVVDVFRKERLEWLREAAAKEML